MIKHSLIYSLLLLLQLSSLAQEVNRYMVFFKDKAGISYSIDQPQEFLSNRAVERRNKFGIPVTQQDLPVNEQYVRQIKEAGVPVYFRSRWLNAVLVEENSEKVNALKSQSFVDKILYVAPGKKLGAKKLHNRQNSAEVPQTQHELLNIPLMHELGYTGEGKIIAVLDDGFQGVDNSDKFDHLFRNKQVLHTKDFVGNSKNVYQYDDHGTKSLSTIAVVDTGTFIGVAPNAQFLLAITEDFTTENVIEEYNLLMACEWADSLGADIITVSLGYYAFDDASMNYTFADMDGKTTVSARGVSLATDRGILVVTSAGNSRRSSWGKIATPADADNILAVGAINNKGEIASFSSPGPTADNRIKPDVVALGVGTVVVGKNGDYVNANGTSFSAPQIAGLAAGIWQAYPHFSNLELREFIIQSADRFTSPDYDFGWGLPSFKPLTSLPHHQEKAFLIYPNPLLPTHQFIEIEHASGASKEVQVQILDLRGRKLSEENILLNDAYKGSIDVSLLPAGIYYLQLLYENDLIVRKILRL